MKIFNTLTRQKEEFVPLEPGKVKMYACGPTVYNFIHIGNARPICIFDTLRRYLEYRGYDVTFVQNFTDIDDKIINKANEEGVTAKEIAERYIDEYLTDTEGLGIRPADHPPAGDRDHRRQSSKSSRRWRIEGFAYEANGDVLFRTRKDPGYGKLSHQPLEDLESGRAHRAWASTRRTRWTLCSGRLPSRVSRAGRPAGARAVRAGTSSAPR